MILRGTRGQHGRDRRDPGIREAHKPLIVIRISADVSPRQSRGRRADIGVVLGDQLDLLVGRVVADDRADQVDQRHALGVLAGLLQHIAGVLHHHADEAGKLVRTGEGLIELPVPYRQRLFEGLHAVEIHLLGQGFANDIGIDGSTVNKNGRINRRIVDKALVNRRELARDVAVLLHGHLHALELAGVRTDGEDGLGQDLRDSGREGIVTCFQCFLTCGHKAGSVGHRDAVDAGCLKQDRVQDRGHLIKSQVVSHRNTSFYLLSSVF